MPFSNGDSLTSTDMNNVRRGLYRDNTDHAVTGTTNETDLASLTITAGTMGGTGRVVLECSGTVTNSAGGTKRIRVYFGGTQIYDGTAVNANNDWYVHAVISNTATNAQRIEIVASSNNATTLDLFDYTTTAIDTTASAILKATATLSNGADTITGKMFEVEVQQIT